MRLCIMRISEVCRAADGLRADTDFSSNGKHRRNGCRDCRRLQSLQWKHAHAQEVRAAARQWGRDNKKRKAANVARWKKSHPVRVIGYENLRRARKKGVHTPNILTDQEWQEVLDTLGRRCLACGSPDYTMDHIVPLSVGGTHTKENVQPLCQPCNSRKNNGTVDFRPICA